MPRSSPPPPPKGTQFGGAPPRRNRTLLRATIVAGANSGQFHHKPGTYALVPLAPLYDSALGARARDLLVLLCRHRNAASGLCNPSQGRLANDLGVTPRSVQRMLSALQQRGHIVIEPVYRKHGGQTSSRYWIRFAEAPRDTDRRSPHDTECRPPGTTATVAPPTTSDVGPPTTLTVARTDSQNRLSRSDRAAPSLLLPIAGGKAWSTAGDRRRAGTYDAQQVAMAARAGAWTANSLARAIGKTVEWLASTSGQHAGNVTAAVLEWIDRLCKAGLSDHEAQQAIVEIGEHARATGGSLASIEVALSAREREAREAAA